jgi:predicted MFS family arabinose efflux permease
LYLDAFAGISRYIWVLGLIMLVNRSGAMVIPFLSVYLTQILAFSKPQTGFIMSCMGLGSVLGSFLGGFLTDKFSYYHVQFWSLVLNGCLFLVLGQMQTPLLLSITVFLLAMVGDAFRPANFASVMVYSTPTTITRSYSLVRLAVNLGFGIGPALGGILAYSLGYQWLFWVDGLTCFAAALIFRTQLKQKKERVKKNENPEALVEKPRSAYRDPLFLVFFCFMTLTYIAFNQFFTMTPVYLRETCQLPENQIGMILGLNGLLIALVEMPLVFKLEQRFRKMNLVMLGAGLIGLAFLVHNLVPGVFAIAFVSVVAVTLGEMLNLPFANSIALGRSTPANRGQYMALYSISFSIAQIASPTIGMQVVEHWGFKTLWYLLTFFCFIAIFGFGYLRKRRFGEVAG